MMSVYNSSTNRIVENYLISSNYKKRKSSEENKPIENFNINKQAELNQKIENGNPDEERYKLIVHMLQQGLFDKAVATADLEIDENKHEDLYSMIASTWALADSAGCFSWVMSVKPSERIGPVSSMFFTLSNANRTDVISYIDKIPKGQFKDIALSAASFAMIENNPDELISRISDLVSDGGMSSVARGIADYYLKEQNYTQLKAVLDKLPHGKFKDSYNITVMNQMSETDPVQAMDWLVTNAQSLDTEISCRLIAESFSKIDPNIGIQMAEKIQDPKAKNAYLDELGGKWSEEDPAKAKEWLLNSIAKNGYSSFRSVGDGIIAGLVISDYVKASQFIETIPDLKYREQAKLTAIPHIANDSPSDAYAYYLSLENNSTPPAKEVFLSIASKWLELDPLDASKWINSLKPGVSKDSAVEKLVANILEKDNDYQMASSWASQISDPEIKSSINRQIEDKKQMNETIPSK
ncbi:MAG: hypothetical protein EAZ42_04310 [Verrucomicrobia bacterium]|nr:MAG: hypothetical protein EAZ42_04310 [Verrucomicrobiota bacterium]